MEDSKVFGDKNKFAIVYHSVPKVYGYDPNVKMGICHMIIENNLIGENREECYIPTWVHSLTRQRNNIETRKDSLFPIEFHGLSDREIFESVLKANQFEEEFHKDFLHVPQTDNEIWYRHHFTIDETIDGYHIYFYVKDDHITFLIEDLTGILDSDERSFKFHYLSVPLKLFLTTVDEAIHFLETKYELK